MNYLKFLRLLGNRFLRKEVAEALESVDGIIAEFNEKVDRLQVANARAIELAQSLESLRALGYAVPQYAVDKLREDAARAAYVAKNLKNLVG